MPRVHHHEILLVICNSLSGPISHQNRLGKLTWGIPASALQPAKCHSSHCQLYQATSCHVQLEAGLKAIYLREYQRSDSMHRWFPDLFREGRSVLCRSVLPHLTKNLTSKSTRTKCYGMGQWPKSNRIAARRLSSPALAPFFSWCFFFRTSCLTLSYLGLFQAVKNLVPSLHDLLQILGLEELKSVRRLSRSILHCEFPEWKTSAHPHIRLEISINNYTVVCCSDFCMSRNVIQNASTCSEERLTLESGTGLR